VKAGRRVREAIRSAGAPAAIGPYSQAIKAQGLVWVSGQIGLDPGTGKLVEGGIEVEAERALRNLRAVLEAADTTLDRVVRCTVYLTDLGDFEKVNAVYAGVFAGTPPSRVCVQVAALPKAARVEIDAVALS
jgi:2-iminobutanoate/2-iminopropanoate deaminase